MPGDRLHQNGGSLGLATSIRNSRAPEGNPSERCFEASLGPHRKNARMGRTGPRVAVTAGSNERMTHVGFVPPYGVRSPLAEELTLSAKTGGACGAVAYVTFGITSRPISSI